MSDHHENIVSNLSIGIRFWESIVNTSGYVPFHWHSSIEIVYVKEGKLNFHFDSKCHIIYPGHFIVVSSGVVHDVVNTPNSALVLQIPLNFIEPYYTHPERLKFTVDNTKTSACNDVINLMNNLNQVVKNHSEGYLFDSGAILLMLIKNLIYNFSEFTFASQTQPDNVKELLVYLQQHYRDNITLKDLAYRFGYNPSYLSRRFKERMGISLIHYVYYIRLNAFYQDLVKSGTPINTLFLKHGLTNKRTARKFFKEIFGVLPIDIRRKK
ncbi:helix-turn-helix domain-containing protein [Secundilactobacillus hailunensis]|uniref:Helix-turn-helix domain-containing protein n=1 Tax=Secundilactobacillus hailunensis TaxID=2559923 RepID=A0ABW1T6S7_9LACO|nr:AraC family transcriptional regulator [Secundilactobacillus hailunensis]